MFDAARLVFIDETSANTKMMRLHGRCVRGERLVDQLSYLVSVRRVLKSVNQL